MTSRRLLDETSVTLLKAAEYIEEHGWCQYSYFDEEGRACLEGALMLFSIGDPLILYGSGKRVADVLGEKILSRWNDEPWRTKEEVVAALRGAAMMG